MQVIENEYLKVSISPEGAELREVWSKQEEIQYMWEGDPAYWGRVSPVLFPIVGRLKNDRYQVDGKEYAMNQHGFLRDVTFELHEHRADHVSFSFSSNGQFTAQYPYEFQAIISYTLKEDSLSVSWKVMNKNENSMYFSIGGHPAFQVPLLKGETLADYRLELLGDGNVTQFELENALIHVKESNLDTPIKPVLSYDLFKNDALIYRNIKQVKLQSTKSGKGIQVDCAGFPYLGIWSKYNEKTDTIAPFLCIEPWHGIADMHDTTGELKEKAGINVLPAGEVFESEYVLSFS
ncbi:aldose 1-epimerase [Oceanobacillus picturae]|uniref:Aldose 1-epimerase n=1 Tax=Oceanobacillus picturae TaxID=171693 RepID=A0A0U9HAZ7_9BACI|nr:aldose 1-epimerase family protein [Oceanobacillus picturae]GAQ19762.1 aldose 1-epimerase [Oceanobacillus picturae]